MENQTQEVNSAVLTPQGPFQQFYRDVLAILTEPTHFFRQRFHEISFNQALVYGIVVTWIAKALEWLTRILKHESLAENLLKLKDQLKQLPFWRELPADIWAQNIDRSSFFTNSVVEAIQITIHPFQAILHFFVLGLLYWLGGLLFIPNTSTAKTLVSVANFTKIIALTSTASIIGAILGFMPLSLGAFVGWVYQVVLTVIGFSLVFQISRLRSFALYTLPGIVFAIFFSCIAIGIVALIAVLFSKL